MCEKIRNAEQAVLLSISLPIWPESLDVISLVLGLFVAISPYGLIPLLMVFSQW